MCYSVAQLTYIQPLTYTLIKAAKNAEYLDKIDRSMAQIKEGRTVTKTMAELEDIKDND